MSESSKIDEKCKKEIENIWDNENVYLENPYNFFNNGFPYAAEKDELKVIHSIGSYIYGKKGEEPKEIQFDSAYSDIVLEIFLDMLERYLKKEEPVSEVYVDISSGHNIYVSALLEALRHFATFMNLSCWLVKSKRPKLFAAICAPILPGNKNVYNIYIEDQQFIVFFESPIKLSDIENIKEKITAEFTDYLKEVLERFLLVFSAIKNNIPLYLFDRYTEIDSLNSVYNLLLEIIKYLNARISKNYKSSPKLDRRMWVKIINSLGFYIGIIENLRAYKIFPVVSEKGVMVKDIEKKIKNIYEKFGLTNIFDILEVELNKLGRPKESKGGGNRIEDLIENSALENIFQQKKRSILKTYQDDKERLQRNFFAHCGLEENFIEVEKKNNDIYVKYSDGIPEIRDIIKEFLLNRV
ncbi:CRISPR-associated protein DxTHG [Caldicellulosiruptor acetigenus I77R1B]|uniref:CRISPR-associated protein DxTHG n=1 Tax=Caldicellulosiruptor acetigenus (strain ATCC 700853 / DSM 12137 / I77R1B) TaxID=632335 RepID=E4S903_CALA7|nr:CRISPR-associated protein DxTHG [Caldicellulosiruptor acetigenus I77R1B]